MVRYLFYTIGDLTYQSPLVFAIERLDNSEQCTGKDREVSVRGFFTAPTRHFPGGNKDTHYEVSLLYPGDRTGNSL